ncbi:MAG: hypothetical protein A2751_04540 [Candidatus Doudnabacteria bacterium RIFCSPHIGHO2_01_FULL_46_14]|uniref:Glycosyl transferase family 1 domain-containing protein n=1 Tax=Candidatus Doudnabacteria bacterium RIFCSPHIGHO2_01_FULL_46_14 TaxID=1817824 RepID=A0A1F5NPD0_9BACT|nr:MAG: hypothetical protein A2751_04540 [Candidatus Doudnabacteria bacterium RIFCSPHIGHO2_01_FULL_46_14]
MRVALVHEFLIQMGGAEKVLQNFHEIFPTAPVYTLFYDRARTGGVFDGWDIRTSKLQKFKQRYKWTLPLMPRAIESFDFSGYDVVLSDSSAFAKGIITKKPTVHICYCHTPTRYLWESMDEYAANLAYPSFIKLALKHYLKFNLKKWDYKSAQRPDYFIANSKTVQGRIKKYYDRDSTVIYPPVDTDFYNRKKGGKGEYFLTGSRLEPYKKIDLVVQAFNELKLPLKVVGTGTELEKLKTTAKSNVEFVGRVSDEQLRDLYCGAQAFVFPAIEDAGIMVLEALSSGTPVIGLNRGGTAEFVEDPENGVLFENQTIKDILAAVKRFQDMQFDSEKIRETALPFDKKEFKRKITEFIYLSLNPSLLKEKDREPHAYSN